MGIKSNIAVLLAAYNGLEWIQDQVDSILNQRNVNVSIFISVDLSQDETIDWCRIKANSYPNIHVLSYGNVFGGAAKNFFRMIQDVDLAPFEYIAFSDQDDVWMPEKLLHATTMITVGGFDAYSSDVIAFWEDDRKQLVKKSYPQKKYDYLFEAAGPGCTYVFKRSSLSKFKIFLMQNLKEVNQVALHDWMIYAFFRSRKMKWYIDSKPLMYYRQHDHNQVGLNSGLSAALKRFHMIRTKWYSKEVNKIYALISLQGELRDVSLNRCFLIKNFNQLRRRKRDTFILMMFILSGIF